MVIVGWVDNVAADAVQLQLLPRLHDVLGAGLAAAERFALPQGLSGYAIARPGQALSPATQADILAALVPVSSAAFDADMAPYWRQRRDGGYFERLSELILIAQHDRFVGWTGYAALERRRYANLYIDSTGMVPGGQSRGVLGAVLRARMRDLAFARYGGRERLYVSARTESPVAYKLVRRLAEGDEFHPDPHAPAPPDVLECAHDLAAWLGQAEFLEPRGLIVRAAYGQLDHLYGQLPTCGDPVLDGLFRERLGPLDAYLVIGRVDRPG